ncbi:hypothetical protein J132_08271 [Termitomyces sp. J132]|nr:hypothetical protein J132_08271 [Termitomyces sp. J132]
MAYRTRLRSAKLAQPAVVPVVEDDHEQSSIQEVSSQLTELSSSTGSAYPSAVSTQAGESPADRADTPRSVTERDAHFKKNGGTLAGGTPREEEHGADERGDSIIDKAVDSNYPVFNDNSFHSESTPVSNRKTHALPGRRIPEETVSESEVTTELGRTVNFARLSMTDEERERYDRRTEHVRRNWARENQFWGTENFCQEDSGSEEVCTDKGKGANPRNWGGLDLPEEELDPGFQQQMFGLRESELTQGAIGNSNTQNPVKAEPELDFNAPDGEAPSREDIKQYLRDKRRLVKELDKLKLKQSNN